MKKIVLLIMIAVAFACRKQATLTPLTDNTTGNLQSVSAAPPCTGNTWTSIAAWPFNIPPANAPFNYVAFVCGNKLYAPSYSYTTSKKMFIYDGNSWTSVLSAVPWPFSYGYFTSFSIGDKAYIFQDEVNPTVFEYTASTNSWANKGLFPGGVRLSAHSFVIGSKGYVVGGYYYGGVSYRDCWEYNPANNQWTQKASMPAAVPGRGGGAGFTVNNKGYIAGGFAFPGGGSIQYYNSVVEYNPATDSWAQKAPFPGTFDLLGVNGTACFAIGGSGYVSMNGSNFYKYIAAANTWEQVASFPGVPALSDCSVTLNGKGYVFNMASSNSGMWRYTPKQCTGTTTP